MAGEWIKMRGSLITSPKLIRFARCLQSCRAFREWMAPGGGGEVNGQVVSDHALRAVALALLNVTWSASREHGEFDGDDLVLDGLEIRDLDQLSGVPGVGAAMEEVGWAIFDSNEIAVTLPNFREYNVPATSAERMAKSRSLRHSDDDVAPALRGSRNESAENVAHRQRTDTDTVSVSDSTKRSDCATTSIGEKTSGPSDLLISGEDLARAEPLIASLFKRSRYKGDDGEFFWRVGVLASVGAIPEALVQSACNGAAQNSRRNAVGFARKALTEACAKIGVDLKAMLTAMKMPRLKHRGAPKPKVSELATSLGDALAGGH